MGTGRELAERRDERKEPRWRTGWLPIWVRWLPPGLVVLALVLELVTPPRYSFASFLTAAVVLAALLSRPLVTFIIGGLSVGLLIGMHFALEDVYPDNVVGPVITLVLVTGFATLLAMILERTKFELVQVQAVAEATQLALLRPLPERLGPVRLAGIYRAADDAALIGGDLYSARSTPFGVRAVIGDVRGKGIGATETVATITSAFREAAMSSPSLSGVMDRIEAAMAMDRAELEAGNFRAVPGREERSDAAQAELFATAVLLEFSDEGGFVRVIDRGHPPMFRLGDPHGVTRLESQRSLPLGLSDLSPDELPVAKCYDLAEGEALVAYSDGVTEARHRDGRFYPLEQRLSAWYGAGGRGGGRASIDPAEIVAFIHGDVTRWAEAINDDLVIVALQYDPSGAAP
ncbi:MAG TPA: PP2C family protein-serine/threonine phosphatase [Streptomyces sp.]|nr:PP2C family protein-serine/threonine phosphatase [Streptomyces sp.]